MASHVFVVDTSMKRTQVKVTPGKYLREILEEACKARKLNPESYTLKGQNNKQLDLSQPFRLSGLTGGAKLQLTQASRSAGVVNVALQLPDSEGGTRLSDKFPSTTSLWIVLRKFEDAVAGQQTKKLNLTQRGVPPNQSSGSGRLEFESPVMNVMGRSLESFSDLQKTLAQLGFNTGSVLIRLHFKNSGQPLDEAMKEIGQYFSSLETDPSGNGPSTTQPVKSSSSNPESQSGVKSQPEDGAGAGTAQAVDKDISMADAPTSQTAENEVPTTSTETKSDALEKEEAPSNVVNGISVYRPSSSTTPAAALQPDDPTIFEPTIDHAKAHQAALQRAGRNTRLLSDKELEEQEQARQARLTLVQNVTIRVRYPDQAMIETTFPSSSTAAELYDKVTQTLDQASEPFELRYTADKGHKTVPNSPSTRLVRDLGFRGKVLVTMVWSPEASTKARQGACLKAEFASKARELKVDMLNAVEDANSAREGSLAKKDSSTPGAAGNKGGGKGDLEAKMKKFLGFGAKR